MILLNWWQTFWSLTGQTVGESLQLQDYNNLNGIYVRGNMIALIDYNGHVQLYYIEFE